MFNDLQNLPMAADQPIVAYRVVELGAGKKLDRDTLTADVLLESLKELLHEKAFQTNSLKIGTSLRTGGEGGKRKR